MRNHHEVQNFKVKVEINVVIVIKFASLNAYFISSAEESRIPLGVEPSIFQDPSSYVHEPTVNLGFYLPCPVNLWSGVGRGLLIADTANKVIVTQSVAQSVRNLSHNGRRNY